MDLDEEAVRSWRGCSPDRPCEAREVGLILISEDPWLIRAMAIPAIECSTKAAANVPVNMHFTWRGIQSAMVAGSVSMPD
jgi:hypothetical protein